MFLAAPFSTQCTSITPLVWLISAAILMTACKSDGPAPALPPAQEQATFQLADGLRIELVAAEPMVEDPVVISFDEDGRLWVVEMRGFMPNLEMEGEEAPVGRISVLLDHDGDGRMDESVVFLDSLVLPRSLAFVPGGVLVAENKPLWFVEDLDGDLVADRKTLLDSLYGGRGLPEHSPNGLWRNLDNWYYNAKSVLRYKFGNDRRLIADSTEFRGQWGISHDDAGRLFYNYNWSQLHADLVPPNYFARNPHHETTSGIDHGLTIDRRVYPIRSNPAVNRGYIPGTLDEEGKLLEFTSACAPLVYRGDALPLEYRGNAFVCEPAGNLVKRNVVTADGALLSAHDPQPGAEFLASTDERFRPVWLADGPDGALYIADMYRGVNQHGAYMTDYLKEQIQARGLEQPIHKGRIWRVAPADWRPVPATKLSEASSGDLIGALSADNGWRRDAAQRLLVERADPATAPALEQLVLSGEKVLGRLHALWTLEGMEQLTPSIALRALDDAHPFVQNAAWRILERFAATDPGLREQLQAKAKGCWAEAAPETALQITLSAGCFDRDDKLALLAPLANRYIDIPLMRDAVLSSLQDEEYAFLRQLSKDEQWAQQQLPRQIFFEMLAAAVARKGDAEELTALLERLDRPESSYGWQAKALLNGLATQALQSNARPVTLAKRPDLLARADQYGPALGKNIALLAQLFIWPGKEVVQAAEKSQLLDAEGLQAFAKGRSLYLSACAGCHGTDGEGLRRFAPPLVNSEWVLGDAKKLALILLHGLEGPIDVNGVHYDAPDILPVMPSHSPLDDKTIANILTYIRNEWGHQAGHVSGRTVSRTRVTSQGRVMPWTAPELAALPEAPEERAQ